MWKLLMLGAVACGSTSQVAADGGGGHVADAMVACDAANPGVRVHLSFMSEFTGDPNGDPLAMTTTGGDAGMLSKTYNPGFALDASHHATVILRYPTGTLAGAATITYYAILANENFEGSTSFTADPAACVDVDLPVTETTIGGDAG